MTQLQVPAVIDFARNTAEVSVSTPPADRLLDGSPQQVVRNHFSDSTGQFFAGVWESAAGKWRVRYSENEFCHITRGRMRLEDESGNEWLFGLGDSFVIPAGFKGTWQVLEPMQKLYVIFEPASN